MKRDMGLIRELLLKLEAFDAQHGSLYAIKPPYSDNLGISGFDDDQIEYHVGLIREIGFIQPPANDLSLGFMFSRLTWEGHDYLDAVRDPEIWSKTQKGAAAAGGFTFDLLKDLAKGFLRKQIADKTGIEI